MIPASPEPMPPPELSLVLACYNEAEILEGSLAEIQSWARGADFPLEIIFVDDASSDNTVEILERCTKGWAAEGIRHQVILHSRNRGRGAAVRTGLNQATGSVQGFLDIDFEIPLAYVNRAFTLLRKQSAPRFLVAHRHSARENSYGKLRTLLSATYARMLRSRFDLPMLDTEAGFKFFTRPCTPSILRETWDDGWYWDTEVCLLATRKKWPVLELACPFERRHDKTSKVKIYRDIPVYLWKLLRQGKLSKSAEK